MALEFVIELEFRNVDFCGGSKTGKPENPEKNPRSKDENQQQTQPTYDTGSPNRTRAKLVGGERDHHCAIPAPQLCVLAWTAQGPGEGSPRKVG